MISCEQLSMALDNAESLEDIRDIYTSAIMMSTEASIIASKAQMRIVLDNYKVDGIPSDV